MIFRCLLLSSLSLLLPKSEAFQGVAFWAHSVPSEFIKTLGGSGQAAYGYAIATDSNGNIYVTGSFYNDSSNSKLAKDFIGNALNGQNPTTSNDAFVAKLNSSGAQQWIKILGGSQTDSGNSIAVDGSGNVYVAGTFRNDSSDTASATDFAGNTLAGKSTSVSNDAYVVKLNSSGIQQWIKTLGGGALDLDSSRSITLDSSGNIYVAGAFANDSSNSNAVTDFAGNTLNGRSSSSSSDAFAAKLNSSGVQQWIKTLGGSYSDYGDSIAVDSGGNVYLAGTFMNNSSNSNTVKDFAGNTLNGKTSATTYTDVFVTKLNSSGVQQWIKSLGGTGADTGTVTVDSSSNVYVAGSFLNSSSNCCSATDFAGNTLNGKAMYLSDDAFIAKLNSSGVQQWIKILGGDGKDKVSSVAADSSGNIYVTGSFKNSSSNGSSVTDFAGNTLNGKRPTATGDAFVSKLNSSGVQQWIKTLGGDSTSDDAGYSIAVGSSVYVAGIFYNTSSDGKTVTDFFGNTLNGYSSTQNGYVYIAKIIP